MNTISFRTPLVTVSVIPRPSLVKISIPKRIWMSKILFAQGLKLLFKSIEAFWVSNLEAKVVPLGYSRKKKWVFKVIMRTFIGWIISHVIFKVIIRTFIGWIISHVILQDYVTKKSCELNRWELPMLKYHLVTFVGHKHCGSGDIIILISQVISQDTVIKRSCDFMARSPSC